MTEQTKLTNAEAFADALGPMFGMWGHADGRECLCSDLSAWGAAEMEREFRHAVDLLDGLERMAEGTFGFGTYLILGDAKRHAERARQIAEGYAEGRTTCSSS